ncbi:hypothetical protein B0T19DRAFT_184449 [Cercophora scortea]|uniref:DUF6594 domain-containing protein n=1 Tax=Cercophora scortea TaxID=314031 RepID=A0AAE0MD54_9PEZI|nr:hypothetical protein B0T19DRAFT_184449 [Cercophora scortea]
MPLVSVVDSSCLSWFDLCACLPCCQTRTSTSQTSRREPENRITMTARSNSAVTSPQKDPNTAAQTSPSNTEPSHCICCRKQAPSQQSEQPKDVENPSPFDQIPVGYPRLAALICKDQAWAVFRKFKELNARNLLGMQSEVMDLEAQLHAVDSHLSRNDSNVLESWASFTSDLERTSLMHKIKVALNEYNAALLQYKDILRLEAPDNKRQEGLKFWLTSMSNHGASSSPGGAPSGGSHSADFDRFLDYQLPQGDMKYQEFSIGLADQDSTDLASLCRTKDSWWTEKLSSVVFLYSIFMRDKTVFKYDNANYEIHFFSSARLNTMASIMTVFLNVILAVTSIVALTFATSYGVKMALVAIFIFLSAFILAISGAKKGEVIMGTFGFAAVLVVFVSTSSSSSSSSSGS